MLSLHERGKSTVAFGAFYVLSIPIHFPYTLLLRTLANLTWLLPLFRAQAVKGSVCREKSLLLGIKCDFSPILILLSFHHFDATRHGQQHIWTHTWKSLNPSPNECLEFSTNITYWRLSGGPISENFCSFANAGKTCSWYLSQPYCKYISIKPYVNVSTSSKF